MPPANDKPRLTPGPPLKSDQQELPAESQRVVLTIGLPGAGKSTWFRNHSITPLSSDELRILLADDVDEQGFQEDIFRALRFLLEVRLDIGRRVTYVDATNLLAAHRRDFIELAHRYGCEVEALYFDVPLDICLARNNGRGRQVPEDVMQAMADHLEPPTIEEGFNHITTIGPDGKEIP